MSEQEEPILEQLTMAVATMTGLMNRLIASGDEQWAITREQIRVAQFNAEANQLIKDELKSLRVRLEKIVHVLHEGNGEKPLIYRVSVLESSLSDLLKEKEEEEESLVRKEERKEDFKYQGKWSLAVSGISLAAVLADIILSKIF